MNNLKNIKNKNTSSSEWREIINKENNKLQNKILNLMSKLGIVEISENGKKVEIISHKLAEFQDETFDEEEFKEIDKL